MNIKSEHEEILAECEIRMTQLAKQKPPPEWRYWEVEDFLTQREFGPKYGCGAWFGPMSERRRMRYRRAIGDLERDRLLKIWREFSKLTSLKLTRKGRKMAKELLSTQISVTP
jgi:hypothetical protein